MKFEGKILDSLVEKMYSLPAVEQNYILKFMEQFSEPFPRLRKFFRGDAPVGKTADGYDSFVHRRGDLYLLYAYVPVSNDTVVFFLYQIFKKELRPIQGVVNEEAHSQISH